MGDIDSRRCLRDTIEDHSGQALVKLSNLLAATLLASSAAAPLIAGTLTPLYGFAGATDARHPGTRMVELSSMLYGVTNQGGNYGLGTIYSVDPASGATATVYSFSDASPSSPLIVDKGVLLGASHSAGGENSLFRFNPVSHVKATVSSLPPGSAGTAISLVLVKDVLYGTTAGDESGSPNAGTIFAFDTVAHTLTTEATFSLASPCGGFPSSALLPVGGRLFGTLSYSLYVFDPATRQVDCLHSFDSDSANAPVGNLVYTNGKLFGVLYAGSDDTGGVFEANPTSGTTKVIYDFTGGLDGRYPPDGLTLLDGKLYGVTQSDNYNAAIYSIDPVTGAESTLANFPSYAVFGDPAAGLTTVGSVLFGTTYGVVNNYTLTDGTVFKFDPDAAQISLVHVFHSPTTRSNSALRAFGSMLYGTSSDGGTADQGAIVALNPMTGAVSTVSSFLGGTDGAMPLADLTPFGKSLCGTTSAGGSGSMGTIFCYNTSSDIRSTLYNFTGGVDGGSPSSGLLAAHGLLYGVATTGGGSMNNGTVFRFDPVSLSFVTLYDFANADAHGSDLAAGPALTLQGNKLVGVRQGFGYSVGVVYSVSLSGGGAPIVQFQNGLGPSYPDAKFIVANNALFGTSGAGGTGTKAGTIYKLNANTGHLQVAYSFSGASDGSYPDAALLSLNGLLYGTTRVGGSANKGTLFVFNPATGSETVLYAFTGNADGANPGATLIQAGGLLYGTTASGGPNNRGGIFSFAP